MDIKKHYEEYYGGGILTNKDLNLKRWPRDRFEASLKFIGIKNNSKVLDLGCGEGIILPYLLKKSKYIYGVDISKKQIFALKKHYGNKIFLKSSNSENMKFFKDNFFDFIICSDVIEHVNDRYSIMNEIARVIKKEGILVLTTPNLAKIRNRLKLLFGQYPATSYNRNEGYGIRNKVKHDLYDGGHLQYFTYKTLEMLLNKYNFKIIKKAGVGRFGRIHNICPEIMSGEIIMIAKKISED